MPRKLIAFSSCLFILTGCATSASEEITEYTTDVIYGTVLEVSEDSLILLEEETNSQELISFDSSITLLKDENTITFEAIAVDDRLMCTYTDGQLTVIEVITEEE